MYLCYHLFVCFILFIDASFFLYCRMIYLCEYYSWQSLYPNSVWINRMRMDEWMNELGILPLMISGTIVHKVLIFEVSIFHYLFHSLGVHLFLFFFHSSTFMQCGYRVGCTWNWVTSDLLIKWLIGKCIISLDAQINHNWQGIQQEIKFKLLNL